MTIAQILADTKSTFATLAEGSVHIKALSGDRIVMLAADGNAADVLKVLIVKKRVLATQSEVTGSKMTVPVMEYDAPGVELTDGTTAVLYKSPTLPKPAKKGSKRVLGAPTKLSVCEAILVANAGADKATICKLFQSEANCTRQGSNTYYLLLTKKLAATAPAA